jgi:peptide chain release factor 1
MPPTNHDEIARERFLGRLGELEEHFNTLESQLGDPEIIANSARYTKIVKEHGSLTETVRAYRRLKSCLTEIEGARELADGDDEEMAEFAAGELEELEERREDLFDELIKIFATSDEDAHRNVIIEVRAGTGGDEAALFASDLYGMYKRYSETRGWKTEVLDASATELGGFKEIIFSVAGKEVHKRLRYEGGGHRVQRVPETESQGRIHTSACTVAVLPEAEEVEIDINPDEIRIDFYHSSGPGGQKVNKTASAVRITHEPTGIVVAIQDEKSQHKNRAKALRVLRSRLYDHYQSEIDRERRSARAAMIGSGDRSQRVRTYNFPQNRVTDHRINLTVYHLDRIIMGELDEIIEPLMEYDSQERVKAILEGEIEI